MTLRFFSQPDGDIALRLGLLTVIIALPMTVMTVLLKQQAIETQLTQQARLALNITKQPLIPLYVEGRDAMITLSPDDPQAESIANTIRQVEGIRTVKLLPSHVKRISQTISPPVNPSFDAADTTFKAVRDDLTDHPLAHIDLSRVRFDYAQTKLSAESRAALKQLVEQLQAYPSTSIEIAVHTDNQGTALGQIAATQARAETIKHYLIDAGIATERLSAKGYGSTQPIADHNTIEGRIQNRRVTIHVLND